MIQSLPAVEKFGVGEHGQKFKNSFSYEFQFVIIIQFIDNDQEILLFIYENEVKS